ncbi:glutamate decarboxylase [Lepeophtheirus salmonis]|uniref:Glutamate decarboxylase n=1 Tax=Lepeophtheirus salmonis TaxID=72036 RepID=A0A0K2V057_LEPSM|nr:glutamate decarboxylase-like [Lepeophtheirus salmonis]
MSDKKPEAKNPFEEDEKSSVSEIGNLFYRDLYPVNQDTPVADKNTREFLHRILDIQLDYITSSNDRSSKILDFYHPQQMKEKLDLEIPEEPQNIDTLLTDCKDALKYQVKTGHPHFFNQLSTGLDIVSLAGEWVTATANTNMFTYEIAPVFILMEHACLKKMRELIGFTKGDSILAPGGSISNMYALMIARHKHYPQHKKHGMRAITGQLIMYTSQHHHYSVSGGASAIGLGTENCVKVPCDKKGRMIPSELEKLIIRHKSEGHLPFFVNCTTGTTVYGAFDPINPIADICEKYGIWHHIDAAWGGGLIMSRKYRATHFAGIERADSVTWNPHKLLGTLLQCSTLHFKEDGLLISCNQMSADYLFQKDKHYDVCYDTGDKVIQCGRHNDIFKFWLQWRSKGMEGFETQINTLMDLTAYQVQQMKERKERFYLLLDEPECTNVIFWYVPERLRPIHCPQAYTRDWMLELGKVTATLKGRMMSSGTIMISYQPFGEFPNFFRSIISNQAVTKKDVDFMLDELERLGNDL